MLTWLKKSLDEYEKLLVGLASIATVVALVFAAFQLQQAQKNLEASIVYQVQRDGRALLETLFRSDPQVGEFIFGSGKGDKAVETKADLALMEMIQYYTAVFNQHRNGVISDKYWDTFDTEMCRTIVKPKVTEFWVQKVRTGSYSPEFKKWGETCLARPSKP